MDRRLSAIIAADVVGYTRLVEQDTDGTVAAWRAARADIVDPAVDRHAGRLVKLTGDGFLAEFPTIQQAVGCALDMQERLAEGPLDFRMGVNLGDIVDDGEDIHGEGVNIAARIEALAPPGGVCISGMAYEAVRNRVDALFEDMGEHTVKHVTSPVRIWRWVGSLDEVPPPAAAAIPATPPEEAPATAPAVTEKPSIAVLPFDSMSSNPDQEYFADGMTEDLITDLSKVSGLFVVARNSSFAYKGKASDIRVVATELGVRFVLEGSIRKAGGRVRINAQLIDAHTGGHVWAERYDGSVDDVFELQDEVGAKVVAALSVQLTQGESDSLKRVHTRNLDAYELFVRARATPYPPLKERIDSAREMFEKVIELDPEFAGGYAGVSSMLSLGAIFSHKDESAAIERAADLAHKAIAVDETFGWSYTALAMALLHRKRYEEATAAAREAVERQPNDADAHCYLGLILGLGGQYAEGVTSLNQALRINPQFVYGPYLNLRALAQFLAGDYGAAIESFRENVNRGGPVGPPALCWTAAACTALDRRDEAGELTDRLRAEFPQFGTANWNLPPLIRDAVVRDQFLDFLLAAGVPAG